MPRKKSPPQLWLEKRSGRESVWCILNSGRKISTGCPESANSAAEKLLADYILEQQKPTGERRSSRLSISEVLLFYLRESAPKHAKPKYTAFCVDKVSDFFGDKTISAITGQRCRDYVKWRAEHGASAPTARRDLEYLQAALNFYHKEYGLDVVPCVTLPPNSLPREEWLTRSQVAALLWSAWRRPESQHLCRFILTQVYTGTRDAAIFDLRWRPSPKAGHVELHEGKGIDEIHSGILYRRGSRERETKKRRPPARLHCRLAAHMLRWRRHDEAAGITHVVHFRGKPIKSLKRSWHQAREAACISDDHVKYCLKHTAATWLMQRGVDPWEAAGYLGISVEMLERVYGHHHPDFQKNAAGNKTKPANDTRMKRAKRA